MTHLKDINTVTFIVYLQTTLQAPGFSNSLYIAIKTKTKENNWVFVVFILYSIKYYLKKLVHF